MNVLIIGGTGFLGSYLRASLEKKYSVDYTYATKFSENGIKYKAGVDLLKDVVGKKYDIVINNINPQTLSYSETVFSIEDIVSYCLESNIKLIHISSVFALQKNRTTNSYCLKKSFSDDLIITEMVSGNYAILRFTQLFDANGLAKKSQTGLYYLLDCIKHNKQIPLFANKAECFRNYTPVEIAVEFIEATIENRLKGVFNAYLNDFTLSFDDLIGKLANLNKEYNYSELIVPGDKKGQAYYIAKQSEELVSKTAFDNDLFYYFKKAYELV